ncbi:MAG: hypothetical protein WCI04_07310 [archaeon]
MEGYIRIRVFKLLELNDNHKFTDRMLNGIYDTEEAFRAKIILEINEKVSNWHIRFTETLDNSFDVIVFTESETDYVLIRGILKREFKEGQLRDIRKDNFPPNEN